MIILVVVSNMFIYIIIGLLILLVLITALVLNLHPVFGASSGQERLLRFSASVNYHNGRFRAVDATKVSTSFDIKKMPDFFRKGTTVPDSPLPSVKVNKHNYDNLSSDDLRMTWFGHSTLLIEIGGKRILTDPMFSEVPMPFSALGSPRFPLTHSFDIEDLPAIDVVLLSHDHYDHLDYPSILKLKDKVECFIAPLGVGAHLEHWGVAAEKINEFDWWESLEIAGLQFTATPARHFSGRGLLDRHKTLWCGWAIRYQKSRNIFYGADSGYSSSFKTIGERLGPFDLAFLECGQYNEMWSQIHAMPEEIPLIWEELNARLIMPIHWGAFKLAMHPWSEPVDRLLAAAVGKEDHVLTPLIGQQFRIDDGHRPLERWWKGGI